MQVVAVATIAHQLVIDPDGAAIHALQKVDAAQEGALARARRSDDAGDFAARYIHVDLVERLEGVEFLRDVDRLDENVLAHDDLTPMRGWIWSRGRNSARCAAGQRREW